MAVYFIRAADGTGPVKIGYAKNPIKRLDSIQRMSPVWFVTKTDMAAWMQSLQKGYQTVLSQPV